MNGAIKRLRPTALFCPLPLVGAARGVLASHLRRAGHPIAVETLPPLQLGVIALEEPLHSVDAGLLEKRAIERFPRTREQNGSLSSSISPKTVCVNRNPGRGSQTAARF